MRLFCVEPVARPVGLWTAAVFSTVLVGAVFGAPRLSHAQGVPAAAVIGAPASKAASSAARPAIAASATARDLKIPTRPLWSELAPPQQQALAPLASVWPTISEAQKRKWVVISQSFGRLPPPEQAKLHSRMTEWVALSPQQRTQARLNFAETQLLAPDDKKAKWEAYQALPAEQKSKLAAGAASGAKTPATAASVKPMPSQRLATVPQAGDAKPPRIAASPQQVDQNTLLPSLAPAPAPAPVLSN